MTTTATERVGRYQLLEPIGHGPSGKVSRAKVFGVAGFERQFAVKRFHSELTSGQQAQALSTAARAYGGLEHPRIARMSEFGIAQGTTYTAVEYVAGLDAMRLITEVKLTGGTLAAGGALALVSQAARAVGYAHGRGLTHLGLSPTNVIITPEGDVKITDFGILAATLPPRPIEVARLAHRIGYLAPEQLTNEATSAATDVFALGVLAYELITGNRTFPGDNAGQIAKAVAGGPPADPPLPKAILRVLQRCLARSPFERFPDARALADALDAALRVAPVPGTRKDIGSQVRAVLDRLAEVHSGELSGMLSLDVGTANLGPGSQIAALGNAMPVSRDSQVEVATMEFVRPDTPVAGPTPLSGPAKPADEISEAEIDAAFAEDDQPLPTMPAKPTTIAPPAAKEPAGVKPVVKIPEIPKFGGKNTIGPQVGNPPRSIPTPPPLPVVPKSDEDEADSTRPQMIKAPMTTVAGLAPPPIPAPPGAVAAASPKHRADSEGTPGTLLGVGRSQVPKPLVGAVPPPKPGQGPTRPVAVQVGDGPADRPSESPVSPLKMMESAPSGAAPAVPLARISPTKAMADSKRQLFGALRPDTDSPDKPRTDLVIETDPGEVFEFQGRMGAASSDAPVAGAASAPGLSVEMEIVQPPPDVDLPDEDDRPIRPALAREPAAGPADRPTNEMSPLLRDELTSHASRPSDELAAWRPRSLDDLSGAQPIPPGPESGPPMDRSLVEQPPERKTLAGFEPSRSLNAPRGQMSAAFSQQAERNVETMAVRSVPAKRNRTSWIIASVLGVCVAGAIAYVVYDLTQSGGGGGSASAPADAAQVATADAAVATPDTALAKAADAAAPADSAVVATAEDAAAKPTVDAAAPADAAVVTPTGGGDSLSITSTPAGAHVYLDGAESGVTPLKLPGTPDKHNIALLLAGHELYVAKGAAGAGKLDITLKEVAPPGGPAGIKVIKCKDTNRYYVTVDGKQTGMMCPTERIEVNVGDHTIEVYDAVTESVKSFPVSVKDTRLSVRVRVEP